MGKVAAAIASAAMALTILAGTQTSGPRTVKGLVQVRPGGPLKEAEVRVHPVPTDLPSVPAAQAPLKDEDLVLGVVVEDEPMAYPIRFLAMFEVVDHRVGSTPIAPSW